MMRILEVLDPQMEKLFLDVNVQMNEGNVYYVQPLDKDIKDIFDPNKNKHFKNGKATRWLLENEGNCIGRIAAFTDRKYKNFGTDFPVGGIGFFDCIDDFDAAKMLFDTAIDWLKSEGMEAVDGPINFGDRDKFWGLMVDGYNSEPYYGMSYNPTYYQKLFEDYGFQNYYNQYYFYLNIGHQLPEKFKERHDRFLNKPDYKAKHLDLSQLEKFADDFAIIYNAAWAQHGENKTIAKKDVMGLFQQMKPIIDPKIIWFAYYKNEPIAMWINIPDLNQYFKHFNGKLGLGQKLRLLFFKRFKYCKRFTGIAFGIVPKYQTLGIDAFMIYEGAQVIQKKSQYEDYEMGWTSEWNPKMLNMYQHLGSKQSRHMVTYRYIINNKHIFEKHPPITYSKQTDK